jgi:hypothetical protein
LDNRRASFTYIKQLTGIIKILLSYLAVYEFDCRKIKYY